MLLFCECMRVGEDMETDDPTIAHRIPGWTAGEYDVLSADEMYAVIAEHKTRCGTKPTLPGLESTLTPGQRKGLEEWRGGPRL